MQVSLGLEFDILLFPVSAGSALRVCPKRYSLIRYSRTSGNILLFRLAIHVTCNDIDCSLNTVIVVTTIQCGWYVFDCVQLLVVCVVVYLDSE